MTSELRERLREVAIEIAPTVTLTSGRTETVFAILAEAATALEAIEAERDALLEAMQKPTRKMLDAALAATDFTNNPATRAMMNRAIKAAARATVKP
jgi:hypothetical protein